MIERTTRTTERPAWRRVDDRRPFGPLWKWRLLVAAGAILGFLIGMGYGARYAWPLTEALYEAREAVTGGTR